ncbi:MAG: endo alpha-1,4 polygalactosaminidase [Chloroflexota bacterium]|nr:endo alpha-1,4 polygalactosaminidase [Chloroflexota bacterium]
MTQRHATRRAVAATLIAASLMIASSAEAASEAITSPRLRSVHTFALALGEGWLAGDLTRHRYDLFVTDGQVTSAREVRTLRRDGATIVLAYISVGTLEDYRPWYRAGKRYRLDRYDPPFDDEFYADTSKPGFRKLIARRVVPPMLAKGFDGLFLDNTDMIEDHPRQRAGMRKLVRDLSKLVKRHGKLLFTQNGEDSIGPTLHHYDGWNREEVTWAFDGERERYRRHPPATIRDNLATLRRIRRAGLLVTVTDYVAERAAAATSESLTNACSAGAVPFVSDIFLKREPAQPFGCAAVDATK